MIRFREINIGDLIKKIGSSTTVRIENKGIASNRYWIIVINIDTNYPFIINEAFFDCWEKIESRNPDESLHYRFIKPGGSFTTAIPLSGLSSTFVGTAIEAYRFDGGVYIQVAFDPFIIYKDGSIKFVDELEDN